MAVTIASWASARFRPGLDLAGHEIAADRLERGGPAVDPDLVAGPQRIEPVVVADRVSVVLGFW